MQVALENYRLSLDHKCQNLFYVWDLEKYSVQHKYCAPQIVQIFPEKLNLKGELIF